MGCRGQTSLFYCFPSKVVVALSDPEEETLTTDFTDDTDRRAGQRFGFKPQSRSSSVRICGICGRGLWLSVFGYGGKQRGGLQPLISLMTRIGEPGSGLALNPGPLFICANLWNLWTRTLVSGVRVRREAEGQTLTTDFSDDTDSRAGQRFGFEPRSPLHLCESVESVDEDSGFRCSGTEGSRGADSNH